MDWKTTLSGALGLIIAAAVTWVGASVISLQKTVAEHDNAVEEFKNIEDDFQGLAFAIARAHPNISVSDILRSPGLADLDIQELERALDLIHSDSLGAASAYLKARGIAEETVDMVVGGEGRPRLPS